MNQHTDILATQDLKQFADKNGVISTKKLFNFLSPLSDKDLVKPVKTPSAQYTNSCATPYAPGVLLSTITSAYESAKINNPRLACLIEIQLLNGLRISEALSIHHTHINDLGQINIRGLKKSHNRLINSGSSVKFFLNCKKMRESPFETFSRFYAYREYKKLGLTFQFKGQSKNSVTHLFRHYLVGMNKENKVDLSTIQSFIGHKSIKSTEHYGKK